MLEDIKQKIFEYKYQISGVFLILIISSIYEYYMKDKQDKVIEKQKEISEIKKDEKDDNIKNELKILKKELLLHKKLIQSYQNKKPKKISLYENSQYYFERLPN